MSIIHKLRAEKGVVMFINNNLDKIDIGTPKGKSYRKRDEHLNGILLKFGEEHGLEMAQNNRPGYKGNYSPLTDNCVTVQNHWSEFRSWILEKYKK